MLDHPPGIQPVEPFPPGAGAECVFVGRTRVERHPGHGSLRRLSYEAYRPMALRLLRDLAEEATRRFGCQAVRVHHAVGVVDPGQASVLVQVACGHRDAAFEACRFLIDRLKEIAPIWKREEWQDGTTWARGTPVRAADED
jgi:molybdopterin synthase catalytic subunit